ncbi:MAG: hypothetical protein E7658_02145 [Ruminococcaceae bacterium]|nr:hypothetical protein [Oscillospiraceae bacterium]
MIKPSISELTQDGKINRYTLVVATAKSARIITDEYVKQREYAEKVTMSKDNEKAKNLANFIKKEYRDEKAVKNAINGLHSGEFRILSPEEAELKRQKETEEARLAKERKEEEAAALEAAEAEEAEEAEEDEVDLGDLLAALAGGDADDDEEDFDDAEEDEE